MIYRLEECPSCRIILPNTPGGLDWMCEQNNQPLYTEAVLKEWWCPVCSYCLINVYNFEDTCWWQGEAQLQDETIDTVAQDTSEDVSFTWFLCCNVRTSQQSCGCKTPVSFDMAKAYLQETMDVAIADMYRQFPKELGCISCELYGTDECTPLRDALYDRLLGVAWPKPIVPCDDYIYDEANEDVFSLGNLTEGFVKKWIQDQKEDAAQ